MEHKTRADLCIDAVNTAIDHARNFAPATSPVERFLAQEIAGAKAEAYEEAGWHEAAKHWEAAIARLGEMDIKSRLALATGREEEIRRLRNALARNRQGYQNILEFRKLDSEQWGQRDGYGGRYGALTREEIELVIAEIDAVLSPVPDSNSHRVDGLSGDVLPQQKHVEEGEKGSSLQGENQ